MQQISYICVTLKIDSDNRLKIIAGNDLENLKIGLWPHKPMVKGWRFSH